ncbi:MAG: PEP-CTERM sorting domain-containing protein [Planctomycetes bacterium]|nr:PEP-CTERM sorting domain-containing protein [Planctomycetota bacterium]
MSKNDESGQRGRLRLVAGAWAMIVSLAMPSLTRASIVLHWTFDEAASGTTNALNSAGNGTINGVFNSTSTRSTNTPNSASTASFNTSGGSTSYLVATDPSGTQPIDDVDNLTKFTIALWFNPQSAIAANKRLIAKNDLSPNTSGFDWLFSNSSGGLTISVNGTSIASSANAAVDLNVWHFMVVTYDGSLTTNNVKFYTGAVASAVAQLGSTRTLNKGAVADNDDELRLGGTQRSSTATPDALFDDVRIYNTVLDLTALETIRQEGITAPVSAPEPTSLALLGIGVAAIARRRR